MNMKRFTEDDCIALVERSPAAVAVHDKDAWLGLFARYNLVEDPEENSNVAEENPDIVALLKARMDAWIAKREAETGLTNPIHNQGDWHGTEDIGSFKTSQHAYDTLHIGDPTQAAKLQEKSRE